VVHNGFGLRLTNGIIILGGDVVLVFA
jgi:hypothetical protein